MATTYGKCWKFTFLERNLKNLKIISTYLITFCTLLIGTYMFRNWLINCLPLYILSITKPTININFQSQIYIKICIKNEIYR